MISALMLDRPTPPGHAIVLLDGLINRAVILSRGGGPGAIRTPDHPVMSFAQLESCRTL